MGDESVLDERTGSVGKQGLRAARGPAPGDAGRADRGGAAVRESRNGDGRLHPGGKVPQVFGGSFSCTVAEEVFLRAALMDAFTARVGGAPLALPERPSVIARASIPGADGRHAGLTERHPARLRFLDA